MLETDGLVTDQTPRYTARFDHRTPESPSNRALVNREGSSPHGVGF